MRLMDFILSPLNQFAAAYVDNIVFSRNAEDHEDHLHQVFSRLQKYGLSINPSKTQLGQNKLSFLGHKITSQGIAPLPEKCRQKIILSLLLSNNYMHLLA